MMITGMCGGAPSAAQQRQARLARHADIGHQHLRHLRPAPPSLRGRREVLYGMPSRASAFSSTQRMERSSSTIQTGFIAALRAVRGRSACMLRSFRVSRAGAVQFDRQQDREHRVARHALALDSPLCCATNVCASVRPSPCRRRGRTRAGKDLVAGPRARPGRCRRPTRERQPVAFARERHLARDAGLSGIADPRSCRRAPAPRCARC